MRISDWSSDVFSSDLKAATGEVVSAEDLGGGDVHTRISGVADHLAENDAHALAIVRRLVGNLGPRTLSLQPQAVEAPRYDPEEIYGVEIGRASCRERVGQYG